MSSHTFTMHAVNLYDSIKLKGIRTLLAGKVISTSPHEILLEYGESSYLFVYRFGCLVFFNIPQEEMDVELGKIKDALGQGIQNPTTESYRINLSETTNNNVEFEYVELKKLSKDYLRMIAVTLGQSASLEYFEINVDKMLYDTSNFMLDLQKRGRLPLRTRKLLEIIGSTASTRQHIISNVAVLDPPDEVWKSKDLAKFFTELQQNFDIDIRFRTLDRKLTLIQDNIEILADLTASRKTTLLEALVVLLIIMELALALITKMH